MPNLQLQNNLALRDGFNGITLFLLLNLGVCNDVALTVKTIWEVWLYMHVSKYLYGIENILSWIIVVIISFNTFKKLY